MIRPKFWYPPELPDDKETTLILPGDVWIGYKFINWNGFSWINIVANQFKKVIVVLGNHDYWPQGDLTIKKGAEKLRGMLQDHGIFNVYILDCDTHEDGDVLFVGATLWTDMGKFDPLSMHRMAGYMNYDGKIAYDIGAKGAWTRFTSEKWISTFMKHRDYIKIVVEQNKDKNIIVITHHAPVLGKGNPVFTNDIGNVYYESDLSDLILDNPHIALWCCGHSHYNNDEMIGNTRFYRNVVGYQCEEREDKGFVQHEVIEI